MNNAMGDPVRLRSNFIIMIEAVFGELQRVTADKRLTNWPSQT